LTLRPPFASNDRHELLRQVAFEEPKPPRKINKAIPPELETIVLKAIEKNPADRYATARELADDLQRYLQDEPIRAHRPNMVQRARKWSRRHKPVVMSAFLCLVVAGIAIAGSAGWIIRDTQARHRAAFDKAQAALADARNLVA
jgi:serine/threonine protein kinase